jgi:hypothetical protein
VRRDAIHVVAVGLHQAKRRTEVLPRQGETVRRVVRRADDDEHARVGVLDQFLEAVAVGHVPAAVVHVRDEYRAEALALLRLARHPRPARCGEQPRELVAKDLRLARVTPDAPRRADGRVEVRAKSRRHQKQRVVQPLRESRDHLRRHPGTGELRLESRRDFPARRLPVEPLRDLHRDRRQDNRVPDPHRVVKDEVVAAVGFGREAVAECGTRSG